MTTEMSNELSNEQSGYKSFYNNKNPTADQETSTGISHLLNMTDSYYCSLLCNKSSTHYDLI